MTRELEPEFLRHAVYILCFKHLETIMDTNWKVSDLW